MRHSLFIFFIFSLLTSLDVRAQITFQKQYGQIDSASSLQTFDAKATADGGYVLTGLASEGANNNLFHPYVMKVNCKGEPIWQHFFGNTQSTANVFGKVIITADSGMVMINNLGVYNNYNGLVVRLDAAGNILWQKLLNLSNGNDNLNDIKECSNGDLILSGSVKSTPDVALIKLSAGGNLIWCKTYGNNAQYDDGTALIETDDGGYLLTGRYISMGTFNAFLLKTDSSGTMQWLKCYGDTNQHMWGFDLKQLNNGDLLMVGSTTLLKANFQSYGDNFIMRLNPQGDTLWTKIFYGTPDLFENAANVEIDAQGNFLVCVATASYPTPGLVPNKHAIMQFSSSGNLLSAKLYNDGSSHYPRIAPAPDGGYILSGFSNRYSAPVGFQTLLMKLDQQLQSGCFESDITAQTVVGTSAFRITQPIPVIGGGGSAVNNATVFNSVLFDTTLCEFYPLLTAGIDTLGHCIGQAIQFTADTAGITSWFWNFGDGATLADTSLLQNPVYTYNTPGIYTVTLRVSNGCDTVTQSISLQVVDCHPESVSSGKDASLSLLVYPNPARDYIIVQGDYLRNFTGTPALYDLAGRLLYTLSPDDASAAAVYRTGKMQMSLQDVAPGIYLLKVDGFIRKIVRE